MATLSRLSSKGTRCALGPGRDGGVGGWSVMTSGRWGRSLKRKLLRNSLVSN